MSFKGNPKGPISNTEYIPKITIMVPNIEAIYTPYVGTLDPYN